MKKLNLAIIGQGRSGRNIHGKYYKSEDNTLFNVKYVVEMDPARRTRAEEEYPGCVALEDYRQLFDKTDIDLVVNASYSYMHYPITKDLLAHGFNVVVEKPFARNYFECADLMNVAKEHGVMLAVFQQSFMAPYYRKTLDVLKSGIIGDILQVSVRFNGFARRWDWQTLQDCLGGGVYNTGPHPIGIALGLMDFAEDARVVYSKLGLGLTSGDANDYAKIILAAKGHPVVDVEISSMDAFSNYNVKLQGTRGTYRTSTTSYSMKYMVDGENPERPVIRESLQDEEGLPIYCRETPVIHTEEGKHDGDAFNTAVKDFYQMVYDYITEGKPLELDPVDMAKIVSVMEEVHAANPLPKKY